MAEHFALEWLALREPADHVARPESLIASLNAALEPRSRPLYVMDLGSGSGSNMRYLAPRLLGPQHWTLVDHDAELLATITAPDGVATVTPQVVDFAGGPPPMPSDVGLVTASALLDLISAGWLEHLVAMLVAARIPALFALSYDGRIEWSQPHPVDERVRTAVNRHQRTDKGFGPALGPDAADRCAQELAMRGQRVMTRSSDWHLGSNEAALVTALIEGWAGAAMAMEPRGREMFQDWARSRCRAIAEGQASVTVGHRDVLALP